MFRSRKRQVRATFLLQLVVCVMTLALLVLAVVLAPVLGRTAAIVFMGMVVLDIALLEGAVLHQCADLLERLILRRAARTGKPLNPRWFIDERTSG